jgi:hypothetical protein
MPRVDGIADRRSSVILARNLSVEKAKTIARRKAVEKTGKKRPWKSKNDFHFSHSFNNNKLDDRDHFLENATASVASLRGLITSTPER